MKASAVGRNMKSPTASSTAIILAANAVMPRDVIYGTAQPTEPVIRFMWIVCAVGGNKKYQCKLCGGRFTGQKATVITHFMSDFSEQRVAKCMGNMPVELQTELKIAFAKKKKDDDSKNNFRAV